MNYNEEMLLQSKSGYCMPFEETEGRNVEVTLGYGKQRHPQTGKKFFHEGIDFNARQYMLYALADGTVSGVGSDKECGMFQTIRYGKYEVTYKHLANVFANFGETVKAGNVVSLSGDLLHMEVRFNGELLNPIEFITMLYGNVKAMEQRGHFDVTNPQFETFEMTIPTQYDKDQKEIEQLMLRWLPNYLEALYRGSYVTPDRTEQSLRNIFSLAGTKNYFFERMPTISNPLGIGQRSMPLACKVQNLLIGDFLNYLALKHNIFLSTLGDDVKKKVIADAYADSGIIDPLAELDIDIQSFDIPRLVTVYPDKAGIKWWTKLWINGRDEGEASVEITREQAIRFMANNFDKEEWLTEYYPKQMEVYHQAIEQTREQLLTMNAL